jgi:hypothetical protein
MFLCEAWGWLSDIAETCRPYSVFVIIYWPVLDGYTHLNIAVTQRYGPYKNKVVEKVKTRILCSTFFLIVHLWDMWKYIVEWGKPQMTVWCLSIACWVQTATNTHTQCVTLILFHCNNGNTNTAESLTPLTPETLFLQDRCSVDGGATRYGLDSPGFETL